MPCLDGVPALGSVVLLLMSFAGSPSALSILGYGGQDVLDYFGIDLNFTTLEADIKADHCFISNNSTAESLCRREIERKMVLTFVTREGIVESLDDGNSRRTYFIVHGWLESSRSRWVRKMTRALLHRKNCTVVLVDWHGIGRNLLYPLVTLKLELIGKVLADKMSSLVNESKIYSYKKITCIGHSLGAHLCGLAGKNVPSPFGRISGLDPAGPGFTLADSTQRLDKTDAMFVDVIHTAIKLPLALGLAKPIGHVDFYPNGGGRQPGCSFAEISCSHMKAIHFYIKSIYQDCFKVNRRCHFLDALAIVKLCYRKPFGGLYTSMGFDSDKYSVRGSYTLETSEDQPYCLN